MVMPWRRREALFDQLSTTGSRTLDQAQFRGQAEQREQVAGIRPRAGPPAMNAAHVQPQFAGQCAPGEPRRIPESFQAISEVRGEHRWLYPVDALLQTAHLSSFFICEWVVAPRR